MTVKQEIALKMLSGLPDLIKTAKKSQGEWIDDALDFADYFIDKCNEREEQ